MPSTSKKQARAMAAAANDPEEAKRMGISQKTAKEFHTADKHSAAQKGQKAVFGTIRRKSKTGG